MKQFTQKTSKIKKRIVIAIPAYNESRTIGLIVKKVLKITPFVIVIDDGSSDATAQKANLAGATILKHVRNLGYDRSLNDGFKKAKNIGAKIIVTFDADGENSVEDIDKITKPILLNEAKVVLGIRKYRKHLVEKIYGFWTKLCWSISDPLSGFKAYDIDVYNNIGYFDNVNSIGAQLAIEAAARSFKIVEVGINNTERKDRSRFYNSRVKGNIKIFFAMLKIIFITFKLKVGIIFFKQKHLVYFIAVSNTIFFFFYNF